MSQEEAIEIAREEIDFDASQVQIRNVPRGFESRSWMVSLYTGTPTRPEECNVVEIDADSGRVITIVDC